MCQFDPIFAADLCSKKSKAEYMSLHSKTKIFLLPLNTQRSLFDNFIVGRHIVATQLEEVGAMHSKKETWLMTQKMDRLPTIVGFH